jgi:hypothetical protein
MNVTLLNRSLQSMKLTQQARSFSVAFNAKSKFEQAYAQKMENLKKVPAKV